MRSVNSFLYTENSLKVSPINLKIFLIISPLIFCVPAQPFAAQCALILNSLAVVVVVRAAAVVGLYCLCCCVISGSFDMRAQQCAHTKALKQCKAFLISYVPCDILYIYKLV